MKQAATGELDQETIVENLDPAEAHRLQRVRNIGIAVSGGGEIERVLARKCNANGIYRHISTVVKQPLQNEYSSILDE